MAGLSWDSVIIQSVRLLSVILNVIMQQVEQAAADCKAGGGEQGS